MITSLPVFPVAATFHMPAARPFVDPLGSSWWVTPAAGQDGYVLHRNGEPQATLAARDVDRVIADHIRSVVAEEYTMAVMFGTPVPSDPPRCLADVLRLRPGVLTPGDSAWRLDLGKRGATVREPGATQFILSEIAKHG